MAVRRCCTVGVPALPFALHATHEVHGRAPQGGVVTDRPVAAPEPAFSLLDDPLMRLLRALRLAPREGFQAPARALLIALFTWLPIAVWAAATGRLGELTFGDGIVRHIELHVRCLVALPLLLISEPIADRIIGAIVGNF